MNLLKAVGSEEISDLKVGNKEVGDKKACGKEVSGFLVDFAIALL